MKEAYAAVNKVNPDKDGLSLDEIVIGRFITNMLVQEMGMAAAGEEEKKEWK